MYLQRELKVIIHTQQQETPLSSHVIVIGFDRNYPMMYPRFSKHVMHMSTESVSIISASC